MNAPSKEPYPELYDENNAEATQPEAERITRRQALAQIARKAAYAAPATLALLSLDAKATPSG